MKTEIYYSGQPVTSFASLPAQYAEDEFESPARSTVPSIAFWSSPDKRLPQLAKHLDLPQPVKCRMEFEHRTAPPKGQGKESHTDLMLSWDDVCVGVEAKYTEPHYETVSEWMKEGTSVSNRKAVLEGWCDLIRARTKAEISSVALPDLTYQMIHRLAAVCAMPQMKTHVLYQVFSPDHEKKEYYRSELLKLKKAIGSSDAIQIWLCRVNCVPSDDYQHLLDQWEKHKRKCKFDVIAGLVSDSLMGFTDPVFEEIKETFDGGWKNE